MLDVVDGVQNLTRAGVEGKEEQFCTLRLSLEVMIDEAARFSASSLSLLGPSTQSGQQVELTDTTAYLTHLLMHRTLIASGARVPTGAGCPLGMCEARSALDSTSCICQLAAYWTFPSSLGTR